MTRRPTALLAATLAACAHSRPPNPPRPARCAAESVPGLRTRAVTFARGRWLAAIPEGNGLSLRAFDDRGEVAGDPLRVLDERVRPQDVALVATSYGSIVAAATQMGELRVLSIEGDTVREDQAANLTTDGDFALIPRTDEPSRPAGLFYSLRGRTSLRLIDRDGAVRAPARCPEGVTPGALVAWRDGFIAATQRDEVSALFLDDACRLRRRVSIARARSRSTPALAADAEGVALTWTDGRAWLAALSHEGGIQIRPTALEPDTAHLALLLPGDARDRRSEIRVIALRRNEIQARMQLYRYDPRGTLRDVGGLVSAPRIHPEVTAPDPWGGALVGWGRSGDQGHAFTSGALPFFTRVCP